jgi:hypothetical protein
MGVNSSPDPSSHLVDMENSFPGVKQLEPEADHSCPSSAKVKNGWSCTSNPLYAFHGVCKDIFTFVGRYVDKVIVRFVICASHQIVRE